LSGKSARRNRKRQDLAQQPRAPQQQSRGGGQQILGAQQIRQVIQEFSGPLPMPSMLQGYEDVVPGAAERIIKLAEDEAVHRRQMDGAFVRYRLLSLILAGAVVLGALGGGFYLIAAGSQAEGIATVTGTITALAAVFLVDQFRGS
jgi:uncharacterized membrane protein